MNKERIVIIFLIILLGVGGYYIYYLSSSKGSEIKSLNEKIINLESKSTNETTVSNDYHDEKIQSYLIYDKVMIDSSKNIVVKADDIPGYIITYNGKEIFNNKETGGITCFHSVSKVYLVGDVLVIVESTCAIDGRLRIIDLEGNNLSSNINGLKIDEYGDVKGYNGYGCIISSKPNIIAIDNHINVILSDDCSDDYKEYSIYQFDYLGNKKFGTAKVISSSKN